MGQQWGQPARHQTRLEQAYDQEQHSGFQGRAVSVMIIMPSNKQNLGEKADAEIL